MIVGGHGVYSQATSFGVMMMFLLFLLIASRLHPGLALPILLAIFALAATVVWVAGIKISDATDVLDDRFELGEVLGAWCCWRS